MTALVQSARSDTNTWSLHARSAETRCSNGRPSLTNSPVTEPISVMAMAPANAKAARLTPGEEGPGRGGGGAIVTSVRWASFNGGGRRADLGKARWLQALWAGLTVLP